MPSPTYGPARNWDTPKRYEKALEAIFGDQGLSQRQAAAKYGVNRSHLSTKARARKVEMQRQAEQVEEGRQEQAAAVEGNRAATNLEAKILDIGGEKRRLPGPVEFQQVYFGHLPCGDCGVPHPLPDFHKEMIETIHDGRRRHGINLPPFHAKTTVVTTRDTVYDICEDPNSRTMIVSKSLPFAQTVLNGINELLTNEETYAGGQRNLIEDWGPFVPEGRDKPWNSTQIYVAGRQTAEKDPTVLALGVGNQIYGRRASTVKFDDIATLENQKNPERVQEMREWIDKEALSRIGQTGRAIWVGTRILGGDIYSILSTRELYNWISYSAILDEEQMLTLWPEHFGYEYLCDIREELSESDFQLVYQNVDVPGEGASFTQEAIDECKDPGRVLGHYEPHWRLIAGLDPAGAGAQSGFTAFTLIGVDPVSKVRYLVDSYRQKQMKAPAMKEKIFEWSAQYPIYEWRVESNGVQSQLVQYNQEIAGPLAAQGVRIHGHTTGSNKWDPQFGVESMAPLLPTGLFNIPWGNAETRRLLAPFIEEMVAFPIGATSDLVMSWWFAELGAREITARAGLPAFNERMTKRWPERVKRRRRSFDFQTGKVVNPNATYQIGDLVNFANVDGRRGRGGYEIQESAPE